MAHELSQSFSLPGYADKPRAMAGDKGYYSKALLSFLRDQGIRPVIPDHMVKKQPRSFPKKLYRQRNVVERTIGKLKNYRRIATRYEKLAANYLAMLKLAMILLLMKAVCIS